MTNETTNLDLADVTATSGGCCGGGGCGCSGGAARATPEVVGVRTEFSVEGMTCGHCVSSVTEELTEIDGVDSVTVDLVKGGVSTVSVHSTTLLEIPKLEAAIAEAGYSVVPDPA